MLVMTLVATIIHMQCGFEMPEALGRGFVSALVVGVVGVVAYLVFILIANAVSNLGNR